MNKDLLILKESGVIESEDPRKLTDDDVNAYIGLLKKRGMKQNGLAHNMDSLNKICSEYDNNVVTRMRNYYGRLMPRKQTKRYPPLSPGEVQKILKASEDASEWREVQAFALVILVINAGTRTKEARLANVEDLDTQNWTLDITHPKGEDVWGEERSTCILPPAKPILGQYLIMRKEVLSKNGLKNSALFLPLGIMAMVIFLRTG